MIRENMTAGLALAAVIIAGVLLSAPACIAVGVQHSSAASPYPNLSMSPFKGPATAPVVITLFSDFQ